MYLGVVVVFALLLVPLSPVIWVAWWMLADLGEKVSGSSMETRKTSEEGARRAA